MKWDFTTKRFGDISDTKDEFYSRLLSDVAFENGSEAGGDLAYDRRLCFRHLSAPS